jgi:hypothetical protein
MVRTLPSLAFLALTAAAFLVLRAEPAGAQSYSSGQNVSPAYEG